MLTINPIIEVRIIIILDSVMIYWFEVFLDASDKETQLNHLRMTL